ncbi:DNA repair protein [uncultured virus]|nr:DNA repair protein [uncultured virus]
MTGDVLHTRFGLSAESFSITSELFRALASIATVIIIPGEHDSVGSQQKQCALVPIIASLALPNLYYLAQSGIYQFYNIVFGLTSCSDGLFIKASYFSSEMWAKVKQKRKYRVALYHGSVEGAITDDGRPINSAISDTDLEGYDYVLLGGCHRQQTLSPKPLIAYAGSLIQQSHSESPSQHGVLRWDLFDSEVTFECIKNDYGFCTVRISNGNIVDSPVIPRKPRIRYITDSTTPTQLSTIRKAIEAKHQVQETIIDTLFQTQATDQTNTALATQIEIIRTYLDQNGITPTDAEAIINLHAKIGLTDEEDESTSADSHDSSYKWKLLELRFTNTLSYGKDNVIDFRQFEPNKIIGIVAPNHYGKTAILDIILFCLFEKFSRGDRKDIIHKNENRCSCSLLLSIDERQYLIERTGVRTSSQLATVKVDVNLYQIKGSKQKCINGADKAETNRLITELIGDFGDYLTTCFCLQQGRSSNFADMTQLQKKEYLNESLKLNVFDTGYTKAKAIVKKLVTKRSEFEQLVGVRTLDELMGTTRTTRTTLAKLNAAHDHNQQLLECTETAIQAAPMPPLITYNELASYKLTTAASIETSITTLTTQLSQQTSIDTAIITTELEQQRLACAELANAFDAHMASEEITVALKQFETLNKQQLKVRNLDPKQLPIIAAEITSIDERLAVIAGILETHDQSNLNTKLESISKLKTKITELRQQLRPIRPNCEQTMADLCSTSNTKHRELVEQYDRICQSTRKLSSDMINTHRQKLTHQQPLITKIGGTVTTLSTYVPGSSESNDTVVAQALDQQQACVHLFASMQSKLEELAHQLERRSEIDVEAMLTETNRLRTRIEDSSFDCIDLWHNKQVRHTITKVEGQLDALAEFQGTKQAIDNYQKECDLLAEKRRLLVQQQTELELNQRNVSTNAELAKQIHIHQKQIDGHTALAATYRIQLKQARATIGKLEETHKQLQAEIELRQTREHDLKLLKIFQFQFMAWEHDHQTHTKWLMIRQQLVQAIKHQSEQIANHTRELEQLKIDIQTYMEHRSKLDRLAEEIRVYQLYIQTMNPNGLPYSMLTLYLPMIEADVNQILHTMVSFSIQFVFDTAGANTAKTRAASHIDLNIKYEGIKPYSAQVACGFERFIIGLAIRMVLCQISLTAKPDFLIVDEGWTGLDAENLGNVGTILNHVKNMYTHVFIISHLDELKNQADHIINIDRTDNYSSIRNRQQLVVRKHKARKPIEA